MDKCKNCKIICPLNPDKNLRDKNIVRDPKKEKELILL